ncbi:hypothetical protein PRIPAC_95827 [Pristionchus pacificus]|uniref:Serpentine receptor class gamma n=1 Tax=Pristionchus pacificus TaxID=54126 RepID=A0A2A6D275_PRIPA|nr:hypothetical protein PRIPAC_95827 [Pristionchus pacificus]|eukprot:PDM84490.1 G protein-coupled receptor [Pristionchus pacificus]
MWSWQLLAYAVYVPFFGCLWIVEMSFVFIYRKDFSSSYYIFFNLCGILSLINELVINFATRLPLFPEYLAFVMVGCHRYFMRKSNIVHYYNINAGRHVFEFYGKLSFGHFFGGAHETVNILISINRTTAIIIPRIHSKIWKYGIPFSFAIAALIGAAGSWHLFDSTAFFYEFSYYGEVYFLMRPDCSSHPEVHLVLNVLGFFNRLQQSSRGPSGP